MSSRQRLVFALIAVVIAVVAVVAISASGGDGDTGAVTSRTTPEPTAQATAQAEAEAQPAKTPKPEPAIPKVVVKGGRPVGGVKELEFTEGDRVRFTVVSDVADEVHVHGYDLMEDVSAGGQATFAFKADITGIFEAELEGRGEPVVSLRIDPK